MEGHGVAEYVDAVPVPSGRETRRSVPGEHAVDSRRWQGTVWRLLVGRRRHGHARCRVAVVEAMKTEVSVTQPRRRACVDRALRGEGARRRAGQTLLVFA